MTGNKNRPGGKFGIKKPNNHSKDNFKNNLGFLDTGSFSSDQESSCSNFLKNNKEFLENFNLLGAVFKFSTIDNSQLVRPVGTFKDSSEQIFLVRQSEISKSRLQSTRDLFNEISNLKTKNSYFQEIIGQEYLENNTSKLKILTRRSFVSVTGREVLSSEHSFKLSRAVLAIKNFLKYLDIIHRNGGYHGAVKLSNISFALESEGLPLDYMLVENSDIYRAQKADLSFFSIILGNILEDLKTSDQDIKQKNNLIEALSPLLSSLKDEKYKNIPSTNIALDLFEEISSEVLFVDKKAPDKLVTDSSIEVENNFFSSISDDNLQLEKNKYSNNVLFLILFSLGLLCLGTIYNKFPIQDTDHSLKTLTLDSPLLTTEELQSAWLSNIPSRMKLVAKQAVYLSPARGLAEEVILSSVISSNSKIDPNEIDTSLLRIAFSKEWEEQLNQEDRRYALAFSLRDFIKEELPNDLGLLQDRHPGIVIAIISSSRGRPSEILSKIPSTVLESLPDPYGVAFRILTSGSKEANCSTKEIIDFSIISTHGIEDPKLLSDFLGTDFSRRLAALSVIYSKNEEVSAKILDTIVDHPSLSINNPETIWAKKVSLSQWSDVSYSDKLFILSGVPLKGTKILSPDTVARLFLNPSPRVRSYASGLAINLIKFKHPGAKEILELIQKDPNIISTDQLVLLGQILEDPERTANTHMQVVQSFIASKPPIEISKILLMSGSESREPFILDSIITVYLTEIGWSPNPSELMKLILHKDKVARMFAYQKIFEFNDKEASKLMLKDALSKEKDQELKKQLIQMIEKVK